jgi:3-carboxy-cis,cis-muconate cycloisomerase
MGKVARDVVLLAQTEVGEAREGGEAGRSSAMPHKHNPIGAVAVLACATRAPGLSATILAAMAQEHERGAGGWQAEWQTLAELMRLGGSAAASLRELLGGLQIDAGRMRSNIVELALSESVVVALAGSIGSSAARAVVEDAAARTARECMPFREALLKSPEVRDGLGAARLDAALDPVRYLGACDQLIDRALAAHDHDNGDSSEET